MRRSGFTLIELMIVVAIVGILSAIAIPAFLRFQLRAKVTEATVNLQAVAKAEESYFAEFGTYVSAPTPSPAVLPGVAKLPWSGSSGFDIIGWEPEGAVYFQYLVSADNPGGGTALLRYTAEATADLDGDTIQSFYAYMQPGGTGTGLDGAFPGTTCVGTGVYSPGSGGANALNTTGACDGASGRSRF
jgi:type IV pilus assembly protein PilA